MVLQVLAAPAIADQALAAPALEEPVLTDQTLAVLVLVDQTLMDLILLDPVQALEVRALEGLPLVLVDLVRSMVIT